MRPLFILTQPHRFDIGDDLCARWDANGLALGIDKSTADGVRVPLVGYFYSGPDSTRPQWMVSVGGIEVAVDFSKPGSIVDRTV